MSDKEQRNIEGTSRRRAIMGGAAIGAASLTSTASPAAASNHGPSARRPNPARVRKVSFLNSRGGTIVGNLRPSPSKAIVIMAHGWQGNKSSRGLLDDLSAAFSSSGYATLAIDFSGCGESSDDIITMSHAEDDLRCATQFVRQSGYRRVALYGNSWGSQICVRAFDPSIESMVLSGALTDAMHYQWSDYYAAADLETLRQTGFMTVADPNPIWRTSQQLSQESLDDYANINQQEGLSAITKPTLILHGNDGWEESLLLSHDQAGVDYLPTGSRIVIFDRNPHSLKGYIRLGGALAVQWFEDYFPLH